MTLRAVPDCAARSASPCRRRRDVQAVGPALRQRGRPAIRSPGPAAARFQAAGSGRAGLPRQLRGTPAAPAGRQSSIRGGGRCARHGWDFSVKHDSEAWAQGRELTGVKYASRREFCVALRTRALVSSSGRSEPPGVSKLPTGPSSTRARKRFFSARAVRKIGFLRGTAALWGRGHQKSSAFRARHVRPPYARFHKIPITKKAFRGTVGRAERSPTAPAFVPPRVGARREGGAVSTGCASKSWTPPLALHRRQSVDQSK